MIKMLNSTQKVNVGMIQSMYPNCRFLVKIDDLNSKEGFVIAVSDSVDTDKEISQMMLANNAQGILCAIGGDYIHNGKNNVIGSIR